jgi:transglutaminase/protease-like cytokinesis protein 3
MFENDSYTFDIKSVETQSSGYKTNGVFRASKYELVFEYKMSKANYMRAIAYTDKKVQKFIATLPEDANSTTKLIKAHDFIADSCVYDLEYKNGYTAYAAIVYGRALCEGYAKAFQYICEELGIPCVVAVGDSVDSDVGHAWNKVKIGKNWYNIDVTNDDMDDDFYGQNSMNYFLLADSEYKIAKEIFYDEIEEPLATDTEHSYYEITNKVFATSAEGIEYMNSQLSNGIPIFITVAFTTKSEYNKFGKSFFDAAAASPAMKKYKEIGVNYTYFDDTYVYILYFH